MDFDYKKYSLENLENWIEDAINSSDASPQEIFDVIKNVVTDNYYCYKNHTARCYELLALLNGKGNNVGDLIENPIFDTGNPWDNMSSFSSHGNLQTSSLICDKDDKSPECQKSWNDFCEENHYPEEHQKHNEEVKDDGMRPWGHSDLEYFIANPTLTEDRISNFPGEQYTEEELDAMCEKAALDDQKRHLIRETSETVTSGASVSPKKDKVVRWQLPVEVDGLTGDCYVNLPDNLLEAASLKEGDTISWSDCGDGSFRITKVTKHIKMEDC